MPIGTPDLDRYVADVTFIHVNNRVGDMFLKHFSNPAQNKGGTCFGDFGGPIFDPDQVTVLAATSSGSGNCNSTGYAQRIDHPAVLAWLYENFAI